MSLTVGSLFSGIGGFDLGLERAGYDITWQVENNDYCRRVLRKHWPEVSCHYDITTIDWHWIPRVDLVCGGFPCQPFSVAGKQRGKTDNRYLWPEVVRCLSTLRPTWFLGENVPGLLHLGIYQVLADLEALGYQPTVLGIPACAVDAPHLRQRLWIVAHAENTDRGRTDGTNNGGRRDSEVGGRRIETGRLQHWLPEPAVGRVAHGIPHRVDRLRGLGNAIVPQIAEALGRMILEVENNP